MTIDTQETISLNSKLEQAATNLVLGGVSDQLASQFSQLSKQAGAEGCPKTSQIAADFSQRIGRDPKTSPNFDDVVAADLENLRQVLDAELFQTPAYSPVGNDPSYSIADDPELVGDFIVESREHLDSIEGRMLILEQNPDEKETLNAVFRSFHTIKGLAGFLELVPIRDVAHEVETLLDLARNGKLTMIPAVVDVVLEGADYLKAAVRVIESSLAEKVERRFHENRNLILRLQKLVLGEPLQDLALTPSSPGKKTQAKTADTFSVRVETAKLDYLMDMVGEMVIAQSLIRHNPALVSTKDSRLLADVAHLTHITAEVQRTTMDMRMIPMGQVFQRTSRLVRDLSRKAGKRVELEIIGEDTELDKTVAEELSDPLMHMVRNSIDHGIETAEERAVTGKNPIARVRLAAYHNGGQIVVEISDDGRGLNREKILNKAQRNGLIEHGTNLPENDVFNLIFEPGFSTAEKVTDISGRGVGMDVVRKHVQKLRGRIDIQSKLGQGTTFVLKLPLTLAIIEGLVVKVGKEQYIVPIFAVKEIFRPSPDAISTINGQDEMTLVRGRLLPVVRLYQYFGVKPKSEDAGQSLLLVAECRGKTFCLMVDELVGKQEVVIKSLGETLKNIPGIAGGAILGDGRVGLILDMDGVYRRGKQ